MSKRLAPPLLAFSMIAASCAASLTASDVSWCLDNEAAVAEAARSQLGYGVEVNPDFLDTNDGEKICRSAHAAWLAAPATTATQPATTTTQAPSSHFSPDLPFPGLKDWSRTEWKENIAFFSRYDPLLNSTEPGAYWTRVWPDEQLFEWAITSCRLVLAVRMQTVEELVEVILEADRDTYGSISQDHIDATAAFADATWFMCQYVEHGDPAQWLVGDQTVDDLSK